MCLPCLKWRGGIANDVDPVHDLALLRVVHTGAAADTDLSTSALLKAAFPHSASNFQFITSLLVHDERQSNPSDRRGSSSTEGTTHF